MGAELIICLNFQKQIEVVSNESLQFNRMFVRLVIKRDLRLVARFIKKVTLEKCVF